MWLNIEALAASRYRELQNQAMEYRFSTLVARHRRPDTQAHLLTRVGRWLTLLGHKKVTMGTVKSSGLYSR